MRWLIYIFLIIAFITPASYAESSYVLPYPSFMPGSPFYKLNLVKEEILKYWYFGNFAQFEYNLKQSDKYLVEAKTLFEYKQYFFAYNALKKSEKYFSDIYPALLRAKNEKKNIIQKEAILKAAALRHIEVINLIKEQVPRQLVWRPEKSPSTVLNLRNEIEKSINARKQTL